MIGFIWMMIFWLFTILVYRIGHSFQFKYISNSLLVILYMPIAIMFIVWVYCIIRYLKIHKPKFFQPLANPSSTESDDQLIDHDRLYYKKSRMLIGFTIAMMVLNGYFVYEYLQYKESEWKNFYNLNKSKVINTAKPRLSFFSKRVDTYIKAQNKKSKDFELSKTDDWVCVFENDLPFFTKENNELNKTQEEIILLQKEFSKMGLNVNDSKHSAGKIMYDMYEFKTNPDYPDQYYLRFNLFKDNQKIASRSKWEYNPRKQVFEQINQTWTSVYIFDELPVNYVYDSSSNDYRFVYSNAFFNFVENYKFLVYLLVYLFAYLFCIWLLRYSHKISVQKLVN